MKLKKDSKTGMYNAQFYTEHGPREVSTKCRDVVSARKVAKQSGLEQIENAARAGKLSLAVISKALSGRKITVEKARTNWLQWMHTSGRAQRTIGSYEDETRSFVAPVADGGSGLGKVAPCEITDTQLNRWLNNPRRTGQLSSRKVTHAALRSFFDFCCAKGWTFGNPARLVRVDVRLFSHAQKETTPRVPFTDEEVAKLLAATEPGSFWHSAIAIGRFLGLRLGDIAQLEWDCFAEPGKASVWTDKRDRRVSLPIKDKPLQKALAAIARVRGKHLFPEQREIALDVKRRSTLSVEFSRMCRRLGIQGKSFHCLRHAFATSLRSEGKEVWFIADAMGHQPLATTRRYIH